ncbi:MAG: phenylacetate--CoA ligase family protein [Iamia sp.]
MSLRSVYERAPIAVQNLMATGYGLRELRRRHTGDFRGLTGQLGVQQWWTEERLAADQLTRLRSMLTFCGTRVPHYRDLFASLGFDPRDLRDLGDLALLPVLDKEEVRTAPERFRPVEPRDATVAQTTGGTTGTPLSYWATLDAVQFNYATYEARSREWAGVRLGDRTASLHGQPIVPLGQERGPWWRHNLAFRQLYLSVYHLNQTTVPAYIGALERFDPEVVVGYTSAVHRLARHLVETGDLGRIRPRAVMVSSECLLPAARADMELAFGCPVHNAYSLGELVAYVSECPHGELHVSTEYGVVELAERDGRTEIVATGLINEGMPLLRYRTGDVADAADPGPSRCGRGLPRMGSIEGRLDDVVRTPEGATVGPAPMSLAFQRVPHLRRAQVVQDSTDELLVRLEPGEGFGPEDQDFLDGELRLRLGPSLRLRYELVDELPRTSGGKERLVVSSLGTEDPSASEQQ